MAFSVVHLSSEHVLRFQPCPEPDVDHKQAGGDHYGALNMNFSNPTIVRHTTVSANLGQLQLSEVKQRRCTATVRSIEQKRLLTITWMASR